MEIKYNEIVIPVELRDNTDTHVRMVDGRLTVIVGTNPDIMLKFVRDSMAILLHFEDAKYVGQLKDDEAEKIVDACMNIFTVDCLEEGWGLRPDGVLSRRPGFSRLIPANYPSAQSVWGGQPDPVNVNPMARPPAARRVVAEPRPADDCGF